MDINRCDNQQKILRISAIVDISMWISYNIHTSVITIGYNNMGMKMDEAKPAERERVGPGPIGQ